MRVFNTLLQVVAMKLLSSSKSRVFARVRVCCVYLQMRVEIYGERFPATVQDNKPLWDPENTRLRQ